MVFATLLSQALPKYRQDSVCAQVYSTLIDGFYTVLTSGRLVFTFIPLLHSDTAAFETAHSVVRHGKSDELGAISGGIRRRGILPRSLNLKASKTLRN